VLVHIKERQYLWLEVNLFSEKEMSSEGIYTRKHHPPDDILLDGKPKWAEIKLRVKEEEFEGHKQVFDREISIDRLNPTRKMLEEIENGFNDDEAEETQKVLVNMMADLQCELVVTLGDSKVDPKVEEKLMEENRQWECYKKKHNIKAWVPKKENPTLASIFKAGGGKAVVKGQKRKISIEADSHSRGPNNKKIKRVARLPSSPRKNKVNNVVNQTL